MEKQQDHNKTWLNNIHPAPVRRTSPVYDLINMQPLEITYAIADGRLSAQDRRVFDTFVRKCKEYPEGHVKALLRKELVRLFPHFLSH